MREELRFQRKYMFRKGKSAVEGDPKKSWSGIETQAGLNKEKAGWRLAWWGFTEKKEASHFLELRGRHQYSDLRSNRTELFVWPPPQWGPRKRGTKRPDRQRKGSS